MIDIITLQYNLQEDTSNQCNNIRCNEISSNNCGRSVTKIQPAAGKLTKFPVYQLEISLYK